MKTTEQLIYEMLIENTGEHFLDSGGAYGRNHQRNAKRTLQDFRNDPKVELDYYKGEFDDFTVSLFHYLCEVLEVDNFSNEINKKIENSEDHWVREVEENILFGYDTENISELCNTYNGEENISQTILFITFTRFGVSYCLLQIHGGCDVRGGYTETKCFKLVGYLTGNVDVYGSVNGVNVENTYNGCSITDENGNDIEIKESDDLGLDFSVMEDTYMYSE